MGISVVGALNAEEIQRFAPVDLTLSVMLLGAACLAYSVVRRQWSRGATAGLIFAASWIPGALMAPLNSFSSDKTTQIFTIGLLAFLLGCQFGSSDSFLTRIVKYSVFVGLAVAGAMFLIGGPGEQGRLSVFELNPIGLGRITGLAAVLLLLSLPGQSPARKAICVVLAAFAAYATFETQSQGPFGAIWIAVAMGVFLKRERRISTIVLGLAGSAALMLYSDAIVRRINASTATDTSSLDRFELYEESWKIFSGHLTGIGWGNLYNYLPSSARVAALDIEQHSHNIVLETAVEGGLVALLALVVAASLGFVGVLSRAAATGDRRYMGMWIYALAIAMTSGNLPGNRVTLLMLGIGVALYVNRRESEEEERPVRRAPGQRRLRSG